jgi:hypothetical protein
MSVLQTLILLGMLFVLMGLKRSVDDLAAASRAGAPSPPPRPPSPPPPGAAGTRPGPPAGAPSVDRLDRIEQAVSAIQSQLAHMQKDHEILDELEENVMTEWAKIIEDKLGKVPLTVPCPSCGYAKGLEPNLLAEEDVEYGCPNCGTIFAIDALREAYPGQGL